jgi:vacuolar-type H+-ATPase subunit C/Vma6
MMNPSKYAYSIARVRAKRAVMLKHEDYEVLLKAPNIHQALTHLRSVSDIGKDIPQTEDVHEIEKHLANRFVEILHALIGSVGERVSRDFLELAFAKYEYETLKALLKAKFLGVPESEAMLMALPLGRYSGALYTSLLSSKNAEQAIDLVPETELKLILKGALKEAETLKNSLPIEVAIDRWLYRQLCELTNRLKGDDKRWAKHLLGVEIDVKNILLLVRGKVLGLQPSTIEKMWLPLHYKLSFDVKSLAAQPLPSILQAIATSYYGEVVSPLARDVMEVERALEMLWVKENEKVFLHYPFTLGLIYAYANLKYVELKDIRALLFSKIMNLPPQKVLALITRHREKLSF